MLNELESPPGADGERLSGIHDNDSQAAEMNFHNLGFVNDNGDQSAAHVTITGSGALNIGNPRSKYGRQCFIRDGPFLWTYFKYPNNVLISVGGCMARWMGNKKNSCLDFQWKKYIF